MKRSVKLAGKLHTVALVVALGAGLGLVVSTILSIFGWEKGDTAGACGFIMLAALVASLICMLHIAVQDAMQRIERRDKREARSDDDI